MKKVMFQVTALVLFVYAATAFVANSQTSNKPTTNDVKIRQRMSTGNTPGTETVLYIKGLRMRNEMAGQSMGFTTIMQCDLKRTLMINERTKSYMISPTGGTAADGDGGGAPVSPGTTPNNQPATPPRGGVVNITNTIADTGERKEMFGFTARRIKTSLERKASPDACDKDMKVETDGWYIDFQYAFECPGEKPKYQASAIPSRPGCKDEVRTRTIGTAKLGFPVLVTTTIYQADGRTSTMTQEVLELSRESLSASLFDVPQGYTLAKDMQELYGMNAAANATTSSASNRPTDNNASSSANSTSTAATPKKPGVIRIGLIFPRVQVSAGDAAQTAETLRNSFAGYLNGPTVEVVKLSARAPAAALDEARQKQCDYVLTTSMIVKKGGGGGGMFGRALGNIAGSAVGHIPGGGGSSAGNIKAKDELSLEYKLDSIDSSRTLLTDSSKAKAKSDGEDIVTPQVEKAAQAIVAAIRR